MKKRELEADQDPCRSFRERAVCICKPAAQSHSPHGPSPPSISHWKLAGRESTFSKTACAPGHLLNPIHSSSQQPRPDRGSRHLFLKSLNSISTFLYIILFVWHRPLSTHSSQLTRASTHLLDLDAHHIITTLFLIILIPNSSRLSSIT